MPRDKMAAYIYETGAGRPATANLTNAQALGITRFAIIGATTRRPKSIAIGEARWPLASRQRLAYELLLYTGQTNE